MQSNMQSPASALSVRQLRRVTFTGMFTLFASLVVTVYTLPALYMFVTAFKDYTMLVDPKAPILWPAEAETYAYEGEAYRIYNVPTEQGVQQWALVEPRREQSLFVDPAHPERGLIEWQGRWRTLDPVWVLAPQWDNIDRIWNDRAFNIPRKLLNTVLLCALGLIGTLFSCISVAYGFSRF